MAELGRPGNDMIATGTLSEGKPMAFIAALFHRVGVVVFWLCSIGAASAATVQVTYTGVVGDSSHDYGGVFGLAGQSLGGQPFTVAYIFDTTRGDILNSPTETQAYGGINLGNASPSLGATISINGYSVAIDGRYLGLISNFSYTVSHQAYEVNSFVNGFVNSYLYNSAYDATSPFPVSLTSPYSYSVIPGTAHAGGFKIDEQFPGGPELYAFGDLYPTTLTVTVSPVPGPNAGAGLPGLVFGFGGVLAWRLTLRLTALQNANTKDHAGRK